MNNSPSPSELSEKTVAERRSRVSARATGECPFDRHPRTDKQSTEGVAPKQIRAAGLASRTPCPSAFPVCPTNRGSQTPDAVAKPEGQGLSPLHPCRDVRLDTDETTPMVSARRRGRRESAPARDGCQNAQNERIAPSDLLTERDGRFEWFCRKGDCFSASPSTAGAAGVFALCDSVFPSPFQLWKRTDEDFGRRSDGTTRKSSGLRNEAATGLHHTVLHSEVADTFRVSALNCP